MKKQFLLSSFFLLSLFLSLSSAIKIDLAPAHINLTGPPNVDLCKRIKISSDKEVMFIPEDKWSYQDYNNEYKKYSLLSHQVQLKTSYPKVITSSISEFEFCVNAKNPGKYFGLLLFRSSVGFGTIGSLVEVNIQKENPQMIPKFSLTLLLLFFLLLGVLFYCIKKRSNKDVPQEKQYHSFINE